MGCEMELKQKLRSIKDGDVNLTCYEMKNIIEIMLMHIGDSDYELRDEIIYNLFSKFISNGFLKKDQLIMLKNKILSEEYMFYKIGEENKDSVFKRSFSVLIIPLLIAYNKKEAFLNEDDIKHIEHCIVVYLKKEKDFRGYVPNKGWAHSLAHISDAINSIIVYRSCEGEYEEVLFLLRNIICSTKVEINSFEDIRILRAIYPLLANDKFTINQLEFWVGSFFEWEPTGLVDEDYRILHNIRTFLYSLYFELEKNLKYSNIRNIIFKRVRELIERVV